MMRKLNLDPVQFHEVGTVGLNRRHQAEMLKGRRMEPVSRATEVIRELIYPLAKRSELFADEAGRTGRSLF